MKNENTNTKYFKTKKSIYHGGVALMALMCTTSVSQAMEVDGNYNDEMPRIRCLWNLGKKNFRESALEILEKKVLKGPGETNPKLRINYLKKLGEFLKESPQHVLNLEILNPGKENEETPLAKFFEETLKYIGYSKSSPVEQDFQTLKLKTFYSRLPKELTKLDSEGHSKDINKSYRNLEESCDLSNKQLHTLKYFRSFYIKPTLDVEELTIIAQNASRAATVTQKIDEIEGLNRLAAKINFNLGKSYSNTVDEVKRVSIQESYYRQSSQLGSFLASFFYAEILNTEQYGDKKSEFFEKAYDNYLIAARQGNPLAAHKLAKIRETGDDRLDIDSDKQRAQEWHEKAAKQGHPYSQYDLAKNFMEGRSEKERIELLQQSAESGYSKAQLELAQRYEEGYGNFLTKDSKLAFFWYQKAATQGEEAANYSLGRTLENEGNYKQAIAFYNQSKDPSAYVRLGRMHLKGIGTTKNDALATEHFAKASQKGNADGSYYLGLMNFRGQGTGKVDLESAFKNFSAAAEQNHTKALFRLGVMKQFGIGTAQDYAGARASYERAGIAASHYYLGGLYQRGLGVPKDEKQALKLWEKAADSGHKEAAYKAGKLYLGTNDVTNAQLYLEKAGAEHTDARFLLGLIQELGIGCQINHKEAIKHYKQAAKDGHTKAQFNLGNLYKEESKPEKTFGYYKSAADQGHVGARRALSELYYEGNGTPKNSNEAYSYSSSRYPEIDSSEFALKKKLAQERHQDSITWLKEKADAGNPHAQQYFGKLLEEGKVAQDLLTAFDFYQKAANQGKRSAQRRLADREQALETSKINPLSLQL